MMIDLVIVIFIQCEWPFRIPKRNRFGHTQGFHPAKTLCNLRRTHTTRHADILPLAEHTVFMQVLARM